MPEHLLKAHTLTVNAPAGESTQPNEELLLYDTPHDAIMPPLPLESLQRLSEDNDVRSSCIDAISANTVGLGYTITLEEGHERDHGDVTADAIKAKAMLESLAARDRRLNPNGASLTELLRAVKWDEEEVGGGYMEVSRDRRTGQISGLFHLPSVRMRRLRDRSGYVLLPPDGDLNNLTRFYNFGEKVNYDRRGAPMSTVRKGRFWNRNEVITFRLYTSQSRDYGLPRDVAMILEYLADKRSVEANVSFFDSSGTPPTILFVQGEEQRDGQGRMSFKVPRETSDRIASTLRSDAGHRHRVAIIPVPPGTATKEVKLGEFSDRDVGFTKFRQDVAQRTLSSFRLQPIFIPAVSGDGRYTAEVQRAITLEQLFDPEQRRYEGTLGETLLRELGFGHLAMKFKRLAVEDDKTRRDSAQTMGEAGTITRREYRAAHGYPPLPEAEKGATPEPGQVPHGWNDELVDVKKPAGAENRSPVLDNRGLQDGIGARPDSQRHQAALEAARGHSTSNGSA